MALQAVPARDPPHTGSQENQSQSKPGNTASQETNVPDPESDSNESGSNDEGEGEDLEEVEQADDASKEEFDTQPGLADIQFEDEDLADMFFDSVEDQLIEGDADE
ncbi:hypothetical protein FRC07_010641 [Ceratobasidium sp. 392]|nr:hypothetical protein FRC07_010641 [Ceratobasidium sp. 392]